MIELGVEELMIVAGKDEMDVGMCFFRKLG